MAGGSPAPAAVKAGVCERETRNVVARRPQRTGGKIFAPKKIRGAHPKFPALPPGTRLGGVWVGEVLVDATGKVARVWTVRPFKITPPFPPFNKSVVDAIRQWEYEPLRIDNESLPFCMTVTTNINLQ
jgi:outer membrane biosynthesis protein TonB